MNADKMNADKMNADKMSDIFFGTSGPHDAAIAIVGEAWGPEEDIEKRPFVGASGGLLRGLLMEADIDPADCFWTNVAALRPKGNHLEYLMLPTKEATLQPVRGLQPGPVLRAELQRLYAQLNDVKPRLIIAVGSWALWALTDRHGVSNASRPFVGIKVPSGILKLRGSQEYFLPADPPPAGTPMIPVLPIIHPAAILRQWSLRDVTLHDLRERVPLAMRGEWRPPIAPEIAAPPTFAKAADQLHQWLAEARDGPIGLACDIETARGLITCMGFGDSPTFAMTIPFVDLDGDRFKSYWTVDEEATLIGLIQRLFSHPNVGIIGQNFVYDMQYIKHFFGVVPRLLFDTMLAHHLLLPGTPKGLDYLSSLYCAHHWYWKDDNKEWDVKGDLRRHLEYNAWDILRTYEIYLVLQKQIIDEGLSTQWTEELETNAVAFRMMQRGVLIDTARRQQVGTQLVAVDIPRIEAALLEIVPQSYVQNAGPTAKALWFNSPKQTAEVLYELLQFPPITHRKTGNETTGKEAINELREKFPMWKHFFDLLEANRSAGVFYNNFIRAPLDPDGRMRSSFNPAGTETFRWSSSTNAFGRGGNLQNIPKGDED